MSISVNRFFAALLLALSGGLAQASIVLDGTRFVFDAGKKETAVTVTNRGEEVLVQAWLEPEGSAKTELPFAIAPPLARVPAKQQQLLRILYEGAGMPTDRESVFWLNVQEIPQASAGENVLQLAIRQRVKVFFRPAGLKGTASKAPEALEWQLLREQGSARLQVKNPTLYHVSMIEPELGKERVAEARMLAPGETFSFPLKQAGNRALIFGAIDDFGVRNQYKVELTEGQVAKASFVPREAAAK